MTNQPRFLIAKYVPDVFRNEPRNIGVVLWSPEGVVARFAGENPDAPGEVDDARIPSFVASPEAYKQWVRYWRREIGKEAIRSTVNGAQVSRTAPAFLDALSQAGPSNYVLVSAGVLTESVPADELPLAVDHLFEMCVGAAELAPCATGVVPVQTKWVSALGIQQALDYSRVAEPTGKASSASVATVSAPVTLPTQARTD